MKPVKLHLICPLCNSLFERKLFWPPLFICPDCGHLFRLKIVDGLPYQKFKDQK